MRRLLPALSEEVWAVTVYTHWYVCIYVCAHIRMCMYVRVITCPCFPAPSAERAKEQIPPEQRAHLEPRSRSLKGTGPSERRPTAAGVRDTPGTRRGAGEGVRAQETRGDTSQGMERTDRAPQASLGPCVCRSHEGRHTSQTTGKRPPRVCAGDGRVGGDGEASSHGQGAGGRLVEWAAGTRDGLSACGLRSEASRQEAPRGRITGGCRQGHPWESDAGLLSAGGPVDTWWGGPVSRGRRGGRSGETGVTEAHSGRPAGSSS